MNTEKKNAVNGNVIRSELTVITNERSPNSELQLLQVTFTHRPDGTKQMYVQFFSSLVLCRYTYYLSMCSNKKYLDTSPAEGKL
jgi:hypothetical protein